MTKKLVFKRPSITLLAILIVILNACTPKPEPIRFGSDLCVYCKMMISDTRYGGELVTAKGKIYKYDSVECLAAWCLTEKIKPGAIHSLWVVDFNHPEKLINASQAIYLQSKDLRSPMGLNLSAFSERNMAQKVEQLYIGVLIDWDDVQILVKNQWLSDRK
jgi:copper chaperone NosL